MPFKEEEILHHFIFPEKETPCSVHKCKTKICGAIVMPVTDRKKHTEIMLIIPICENHAFKDLTPEDLEDKLTAMALEEDSRGASRP